MVGCPANFPVKRYPVRLRIVKGAALTVAGANRYVLLTACLQAATTVNCSTNHLERLLTPAAVDLPIDAVAGGGEARIRAGECPSRC